MKSKYSRLSSGLAFAALSVSAVCLLTSLWQSKTFIEAAMGTGAQSKIMAAGIFGVLLGSQVITRMTAQCIKAGANVAILLLGIASMLIIESLSVGISTVAFDGNLLASSRTANHSSPEYQQAISNIKVFQNQIDSLQQQSAELPSDWITRKRELADQILSLQERVMQQQEKANQVNVSVSDQAFNRMEQTIGIGQDKIALIMGLLLSLVPLVVNLLAGSLNWIDDPLATKKGKPTGKKLRANLRAVSA